LPAIRVRSDIERKRLLGVGELVRTDSKPGQGAYSDRARSGVYERMAETIDSLLGAGFNVIADASFLSRKERDLVKTLADQKELSLVFVDTNANTDELVRRLRDRSAAGDDVSEADAGILHYQREHSDPLNSEERRRTVYVATDGRVDPGAIIKQIKRMERNTSACR